MEGRISSTSEKTMFCIQTASATSRKDCCRVVRCIWWYFCSWPNSCWGAELCSLGSHIPSEDACKGETFTTVLRQAEECGDGGSAIMSAGPSGADASTKEPGALAEICMHFRGVTLQPKGHVWFLRFVPYVNTAASWYCSHWISPAYRFKWSPWQLCT